MWVFISDCPFNHYSLHTAILTTAGLRPGWSSSSTLHLAMKLTGKSWTSHSLWPNQSCCDGKNCDGKNWKWGELYMFLWARWRTSTQTDRQIKHLAPHSCIFSFLKRTPGSCMWVYDISMWRWCKSAYHMYAVYGYLCCRSQIVLSLCGCHAAICMALLKV